VYDETGLPIGLPESMLPVELPDVEDFSPRTFADDDTTSDPETPLSRAKDWVEVTLDLGDGPRVYTRETNVMPQWAGSCWYELRYLDPTNAEKFVDPANEAYWMGPQHPGDCGGVDLYVGGVEHAVLHLLYARFWHKVLYDLGYVTSEEPFRRLVNQGYISAYAYTDSRGFYVPAAEVEERDGQFFYEGEPVNREYGKIGKSLKNMVTPDEMIGAYGADTFRVYEMSTGPLDQSRPWETKAVVGSQRLLQFADRGEVHDELLWTAIAAAVGAYGNTTALVGTPEQVAESLLAYYDLGVTTLLIRGFDPLNDAREYGRELIPLVRAGVRERERVAVDSAV
jgi:leucyl-tRNA synthetase